MVVRKLNIGQKNLLHALYDHTVNLRKTPGMFRQRYEEGCSQKMWGVDETLILEEERLIKLPQGLLQAGIMCPSLTSSGRRYVEAVA